MNLKDISSLRIRKRLHILIFSSIIVIRHCTECMPAYKTCSQNRGQIHSMHWFSFHSCTSLKTANTLLLPMTFLCMLKKPLHWLFGKPKYIDLSKNHEQVVRQWQSRLASTGIMDTVLKSCNSHIYGGSYNALTYIEMGKCGINIILISLCLDQNIIYFSVT